MRIHQNGYVSGDPRVLPASPKATHPDALPDEVDVLIIGAGPAGMITAAQLARFGDITTCVVDRRPGRLEVGQADGISCRSVETFQAFGFADEIRAEAQRITEITFWQPNPDEEGTIHRTGRAVDVPEGLSEFPHLIVNQARVLDFFAKSAAQSPARLRTNYGWEFAGLTIPEDNDAPVEVKLVASVGSEPREERTVKARYVLGSDGARSGVRKAIGAQHTGASANHAWGVVDALAVTDFPDTRVKSAIQSEAGSMLLIPREGGHLFRMYIDLGPSGEAGREVRKTPLEDLVATAQRILHPYKLDVRHVPWFSVYEVGHRLTDRFDDVLPEQRGERHPRVFLAGDACHTHSAKAGQGMNVSMQDGYNLGWKLAQVLRGQSDPGLLLTYADERLPVAHSLIEFDKERARISSARHSDLHEGELVKHYAESAEFTAGFSVCYPADRLIGQATHQSLATGFPIGRRFHSSPVVRAVDNNPVQLGHLHEADGRWRLYAFAGTEAPGEDSELTRWATWLAESPDSPLVTTHREGADTDAVFDVKVVYQTPRTDFDVPDVPQAFLPTIGRFGLVDQNKVFTLDPDSDIYAERGVDRSGAVVVVRPDQYVAHVLPLSGTDELAEFFRGVFA